MEQRAKLVAVKGNAVHGVVPNTDGAAAVRELYAYLLGTNLPERYPGIFSVLPAENESGKRHTKSSVTGKTVPTIVSDTSDSGAEAALRVLGTTVEEDMFILQEEPDGSHRCVAFMCCFPSGFDPASKLGEGLAGIHAPVPSYDKIGPSMERFFGRMEAGKPVCRQNVSTSVEMWC